MEVIKFTSALFNIYHLFFKQSNKQLTNRSTAKPIVNIKIKIRVNKKKEIIKSIN
jgi:hypothetical protein